MTKPTPKNLPASVRQKLANLARVRNVDFGLILVRQSAKREKLPYVLELDELKKLLAELESPARALVFLTAATGLRVSEALGLKWSDIDFAAGEIRLSRAVAHSQHC